MGGVALLTAASCAAACDHPWDDFEHRPSEAGGEGGSAGAGGGATGGAGGAISEECQNVCDGWEACAGSEWPTCESECATCTSGEIITIGYCAASFTQLCPQAITGFNACVGDVPCIDPPPA